MSYGVTPRSAGRKPPRYRPVGSGSFSGSVHQVKRFYDRQLFATVSIEDLRPKHRIRKAVTRWQQSTAGAARAIRRSRGLKVALAFLLVPVLLYLFMLLDRGTLLAEMRWGWMG